MVANVLDFGAVGDGVTDDTTAFDAAFTTTDCVEVTATHLVDPATFPKGHGKRLLFNGGRLTTAFGGLTGLRVRSGGSFSSMPTLTISGDGTGASADPLMGAFRPHVAVSGSSYEFRAVLEVQGGNSTRKARIIVTGQAVGAISSAFVSDPGSYSVLPSNPVTTRVLQGNGTGAKFNLEWQIVGATVTNPGSGYSSAPAVTTSAFLLVPVLDAVGAEFDFHGTFAAGAERIFDGYGATTSNHANETVHPEWWGAGHMLNSGTALQRGLDAAKGKILALGPSTYRTDRPLTPPANVTVRGTNRTSSVITPTSDSHVFLLEEGFDAYFEHFGVRDSDNAMSFIVAAFYFDATRAIIQRTYVRDVVLEIGGRGFATPNFERMDVFGCEFENVNIYSNGASVEFFYTTGCKFRHVLGEHIGRPQSSMVLRDFWFFNSTAMLGGGLILHDVTSRVPFMSGIVLEGVGGSHAYPRFLQAWLYECSVDNAGGHGIHIARGEQIHVHRGYFALCGGRIGGNCLRAENGFTLTIQDAQFHDGNGPNIAIFGMSGVLVEGNVVRRSGVFASNVGIQFDNSASPVSEFQVNANSVRNCLKGIEIVGAANLFQVVGNNATFNGAGSEDGIVISPIATRFQNANNLT